jgi:hypothetical protein
VGREKFQGYGSWWGKRFGRSCMRSSLCMRRNGKKENMSGRKGGRANSGGNRTQMKARTEALKPNEKKSSPIWSLDRKRHCSSWAKTTNGRLKKGIDTWSINWSRSDRLSVWSTHQQHKKTKSPKSVKRWHQNLWRMWLSKWTIEQCSNGADG